MIMLTTKIRQKALTLLASLIITFSLAGLVYGQVIINVLAVNGTDKPQEKEIREILPKELTEEDVLDTAGLKLDYDVNEKAQVLTGKVSLGPKESKTFKVRIRDVWKVEDQTIKEIKEQIDKNVKNTEDKDYHATALKRKEELLRRLNYIVQEHNNLNGNVQSRIDHYRLYKKELAKIRDNSVSITFWRGQPIPEEEQKYVKYVIEIENPDKREKTVQLQNYLPSEVKPDNIPDKKGFEISYDVERQQSYLHKEEKFGPHEKKRIEILIEDIWHIPQQKLENMKERTVKAYSLLEKTKYKETADFLVNNIKKYIQGIEDSQKVERPIKEHISAYRVNQDRFELAERDIQALENLLLEIREHLERSMLKNVLTKIKMLKSLADIASAILKKPTLDMMWKIIISVVGFIGVLTLAHFAIWGKRSRNIKEEELEEKGKKEDKD